MEGKADDLPGQPWAYDHDAENTHFQLGARISGGAMGAVFRATFEDEQVAAKTHHAFRDPEMYGLEDPVHFDTIVREVVAEITAIAALQEDQPGGGGRGGGGRGEQRRPCIVGFRGVVYTRVQVGGVERVAPTYIMMELVEGPATLHDLMAAWGGMPIDVALRYVRELAAALVMLHVREYMHRDVKPKNILVDKAGRLRLADLGLAKFSMATGASHTQCGTPSYMAPEMGITKHYTVKVDVYALGTIATEMLRGAAPEGMHQERAPQVEEAAEAFPGAGELLRGCTAEDPRERWTAVQVVNWIDAQQQQGRGGGSRGEGRRRCGRGCWSWRPALRPPRRRWPRRRKWRSKRGKQRSGWEINWRKRDVRPRLWKGGWRPRWRVRWRRDRRRDV